MENLLSQFFLAPTTSSGPVSGGKQSNQTSANSDFGSFLEKASQSQQPSNSNDTILDSLSPDQLQALSVLYAQLQEGSQASQIQPQPLAIATNTSGTDIVIAQPSEQINIPNFTAEQLNTLQQMVEQNVTSNSQNITSSTQSLADKIFQLIEGQQVAQNVSVQATTVSSVASIETAALSQASTNFSTALGNVTDQRLKPETTKAEYTATSSLISPKVGQENDAATKTLPVTQNQNPSLNDARNFVSLPTTTANEGKTEDSSIFSQLFATTTSSTNQSPINGQTPVILPSGRLVYDDQVLQQFSNQLRINANELQQKINIRLNPAELGELKIDLTMKEGAVRVNVLAHSQQAQEILERNMPKLRNVLEKQGLSVEGITVTQESSELSDFGHFHDQLTQDQSSQKHQGKRSFSQEPNSASKTEAPENLDEVVSTNTESSSDNSVNLVA